MLGLVLGASNVERAAAGATIASPAYGALNAKSDFGAVGNGQVDDTPCLQRAITESASRQVPVFLPPGVYHTTQPLRIPPNTQLHGTAAAGNFGCRLEPYGCAAFVLGRDAPSFHVVVENILIWPRGAAANHVLEIGNSYSCTFRNIRIYNVQSDIKAAVLLRGADAAAGIEPCNSISWHNLIVRNDSEQPPVAILASPRCGTHRFYGLDLENYQTLLEYQGGQLDLIAPYMERAGRYGVHCNDAADDPESALNTFGGSIGAADSGIALGVHRLFGAFASYGTAWGFKSSRASYFYAVPKGHFSFHGIRPNLTGRGTARFDGVDAWADAVEFSVPAVKARVPVTMRLAAGEWRSIELPMPGVIAGMSTVSVALTGNARGAIVSGYVSADDVITLNLVNPTSLSLELQSVPAAIECRIA